MISTVSLNEDNSYRVTLDFGRVMNVPNSEGNRHYQHVKEWMENGGVVSPYVPPAPQTDEEAFQELMKNKHLKALFVAIGKKAGFAGIPQIITAYKAEL